MDYLFQDGGKPKKTKSKTKTTKSKTSTKTGTKTTKSKTSTKTGTKTTKSKTSTKKGGNFLGAVGDLVAPTGWGPFATAAGLLALDRADAVLRRGKSSAKKGGMRGGNKFDNEAKRIITNDNELHKMFKTLYKHAFSSRIQDRNATGIYCEELDEYIEKEIENRKNLIKSMTDDRLKQDILRSITDLQILQSIGSENPRNFSNFSNLSNNQSKITEYNKIFKGLYPNT
jgi:hypothetical protein